MLGRMTSHPAATPVPPAFVELLRRIESGSAIVGICGLGYVGLPLAKAACEGSCFRIIGFDTDSDKIKHLNAGRSYIRNVASATIVHMIDTGRFDATGDFDRIAELDAVLICVPTPLGKQREPDLSFVVDTARTIARRAHPGQLIILESTTYPGTTRDVLKPIFEERGLSDGKDIFLAFSPEREDPGNRHYQMAKIPKVVGADDERARILASKLYGAFVQQIVPVSSSAVAEAIKLTENIFRAVNIALVNELKVIFASMGIDIWEVIAGAQTKPFGFMPFYPGPGLGGHCIPIDPFYLTWRAREFGMSTRLVELAGEINSSMPNYIVETLASALDHRRNRKLCGASVLIAGLAYKKNVDDMRESPALRLIELLEERGERVSYTDPYIPRIPLTRDHSGLVGRASIALTAAEVGRHDVVLIVTDHDEVDYRLIADNAKLIVDTRNVCERLGLRMDSVVKA
jgi:UDP-N-acetyl-D-glucosamine dehydrogenase